MAHYERREDLKQVAQKLIESRPELQFITEHEVKVDYRSSDQKKMKGNMAVLGDCEKVRAKDQMYIPFDYIITVYDKNIEELNDEQMAVLLHHELLHIDAERMESGELIRKIRPHDIGEFYMIAKEYGLDWAGELAGR